MLKGGGLTTGGLNFDAKIRRQSIDLEDLIHAHVGGIDICAEAFLKAARMIEGDVLTGRVRERYAGWDAPDHAARSGTLEEVAAAAERRALSPSRARVDKSVWSPSSLVPDFLKMSILEPSMASSF